MNTDNQGIKNFTKIFLYGVNCVYLIVVRNIRSAVSKRNFGLKNQNFDLNLNF